MSLQPLTDLLQKLRASLKNVEDASGQGHDGPALAELKSHLRLRISTLEIAMRRAAESASAPPFRKIPPSPPPDKEL